MPPGTDAEALVLFGIPTLLLNVPIGVEQLLVVQTWKVIVPVSLGSGSLKVALRVGVAVLSRVAAEGETSAGAVGAMLSVLLVIEPLASESSAASLPAGVVRSVTTGPLLGLV